MASLGDIWNLQHEYIKALKAKSYSELSSIPSKTKIDLPTEYQGLSMYVCSKKNKSKELEVTVEVYEEGMFRSSIVSPGESISFRSSSIDGFKMFPDGTILPMHEDTFDD